MKTSEKSQKKVVITSNGPYIVSGNIPLSKEIIISDDEGNAVKLEKGGKFPLQETYALCRCGKSKNHPFCDGTHVEIDFDGTETASKKRFLEQAEKIEGPALTLYDVENLCAVARFCHNKVGRVWELTEFSDKDKFRQMALKQACDCPSGRLVMVDKKTGKAIEPKLEPSISLIEDPYKKVSGPIWLKGGIKVLSSDGHEYEIRNRVTLCRCGKSENKPFCDANHIGYKFNDGDESIN